MTLCKHLSRIPFAEGSAAWNGWDLAEPLLTAFGMTDGLLEDGKPDCPFDIPSAMKVDREMACLLACEVLASTAVHE